MAREFVKLVAHLDKLPSLSASINRVLTESESRKSSSASMARILAEDPPLSARVLRVANSGMYARGGSTEDIAMAVTRIGGRELRNIVTAAVVAQYVDDDPILNLVGLYEAALATAIVMEVVSRHANGAMPAAAKGTRPYFTVGLLHDIGLFALSHLERKKLVACIHEARDSMRPLYEVEREQLGYGHTDVGAALLQRWRLPAMVVEACRWHHDPSGAPAPHTGVAQALHVAELIVGDMDLWPDHEILVPFPDRGSFEGLGIEIGALPKLYDEAAPVIDQVRTLAAALR